MEGYMHEHLESILFLYGEKSYVQIPNGLYLDLVENIESTQQVAFAYSYLVLSAFLYKYSHYVDYDNKTYIQNKDFKQILGYGANTKSIDCILRKGSILDEIGLTALTNDYPVSSYYLDEKINKVNAIEFTMRQEIKDIENITNDIIKDIVKNKNYKIKKPLFLFQYKDDIGTLYDYDRTHRIELKEFMEIIYNRDLGTIGLYLYAYIKSKCFGWKNNRKDIRLHTIMHESGMCKNTLYDYLDKLKQKQYIEVEHKGWRNRRIESIEANHYVFKGI